MAAGTDAPAPAVRRNPEETRERILLAAVREFSEAGFSGGRIDQITRAANVNTRMIYHYFGDKAGLYVAVLEHVLGRLRREELALDVEHLPPAEGMLQLFDFIYDHFGGHPELINLLSAENLQRAEFLTRSSATPVMSSPVIGLISALIARGEASGDFRTGIDPLHLYVLMVGMSYFHRSNAHTLSAIFRTDIRTDDWQAAHRVLGRDVLARYLVAAG